jgi:hypothetical protein
VLYVPQACITHHENTAASTTLGPRRAAAVTRANLYYHRKHYGRPSAIALAAATALGSLARLLVLAAGLPLWPFAPRLRQKFAECWHTLVAALGGEAGAP